MNRTTDILTDRYKRERDEALAQLVELRAALEKAQGQLAEGESREAQLIMSMRDLWVLWQGERRAAGKPVSPYWDSRD